MNMETENAEYKLVLLVSYYQKQGCYVNLIVELMPVVNVKQESF